MKTYKIVDPGQPWDGQEFEVQTGCPLDRARAEAEEFIRIEYVSGLQFAIEEVRDEP